MAGGSTVEGPVAPEAPVRKGKSASWALGLRIASAVLFVPLLLLLARAGGFVFFGFVVLQTLMGLSEFWGMMRAKGHRPYAWLGHAAAAGLMLYAWRPQMPYAPFVATLGLMGMMIAALRHSERRDIVENLATTLFGVAWIAWFSMHVLLLRELPWRAGLAYDDGAKLVLYAFLVTWSCDTGAYTVGRMLGRTRPWASISPRKTVEGAVGGFLFAIAGAWAGAHTFMHPASGLPWLRDADACAIGVLVGVLAQAGDFVESLLKRDSGSGDSSDIIPGHGGVLDRFDSLYFGAPVVYYYLTLIVFRVP